MKRSEMIEIMTKNISKQALEKGVYQTDLTWLDVTDLLEVIEGNGMLPPPDEVFPIAIDGNKGIVLEIMYNHGPAKNTDKGIYSGWEEE